MRIQKKAIVFLDDMPLTIEIVFIRSQVNIQENGYEKSRGHKFNRQVFCTMTLLSDLSKLTANGEFFLMYYNL